MNLRLFFLLVAVQLSACLSAYAADSCRNAECHPTVGGTQNTHEPLKEGDCTACHKPVNPVHPLKGGKSFTLTEKGAALCYQCHTPYGKKKVIHPPVADGECAYCHRPHGGGGRYLLDPTDDRTELCLGCHDGADFKRKVRHGPVAVGACVKCHDPHESNEKKLLPGPIWETCLKCHTDFVKALSESPFIHPPVKGGPCTACHNPHSSDYNQLIRKPVPDLCFGCHKNIEKKLKLKVVHLPLRQAGGCANCHSSHFSVAKSLLAGDDKTVCLGCHGTDTLGKPPLRNIKREIEGKKFLHGPLQKGNCRACHDPHGSDSMRLLKGAYPADLYVTYKEGIYGLCLSCHEKNLLRFPDTTQYTRFRNGNRNLHYVHVVGRKGRTCRVCHEPHASNGEKLISIDGARFGDWKIPINFRQTATGGSCAPGCHRPLNYDRTKPENYRAEAK
jgi:predicted CXXCH cytochrome family protein